METMIQIKDVTKTFVGKDNTVEALKGINLEIHKGEIYGIIGMSGAGKSTLVRCLNFLERPTSGTVFVEGKDLSALNDSELLATRTQISMIFQHFNLLMQRTVLDNICFPMEITRTPRKDAVQRARELLSIPRFFYCALKFLPIALLLTLYKTHEFCYTGFILPVE